MQDPGVGVTLSHILYTSNSVVVASTLDHSVSCVPHEGNMKFLNPTSSLPLRTDFSP